jgi:hypothetical protein
MKTRYGATIMAVAFLATLAIPFTVLAGRGGAGGGGKGTMGGAAIGSQPMMQNRIQDKVQDHSTNQVKDRDRDRDRDRLHQGSGAGAAVMATSGESSKKGNTYGPGDGTGPYLPNDGTGYGAPANR